MKPIILFFCVLVFCCTADAADFFKEAGEDALSPLNSKALPVLEIGAGLTVISIIFEENLKDKLQSDVSSDRPLKTSSKIGDVLGKTVPNAAYALAMGTNYLFNKDQKSYDRMILMTKATLYSGIMTDGLKRVVRETRPNGGKYSFPSGHATSAFAFASVVTMEHSLAYGIAANTMAIFVSVSRMNDNAHFLQDVIAGATIGTMYGVGLYYAQKKREEHTNQNQLVTLIYPLSRGLGGNLIVDF